MPFERNNIARFRPTNLLHYIRTYDMSTKYNSDPPIRYSFRIPNISAIPPLEWRTANIYVIRVYSIYSSPTTYTILVYARSRNHIRNQYVPFVVKPKMPICSSDIRCISVVYLLMIVPHFKWNRSLLVYIFRSKPKRCQIWLPKRTP